MIGSNCTTDFAQLGSVGGRRNKREDVGVCSKKRELEGDVDKYAVGENGNSSNLWAKKYAWLEQRLRPPLSTQSHVWNGVGRYQKVNARQSAGIT